MRRARRPAPASSAPHRGRSREWRQRIDALQLDITVNRGGKVGFADERKADRRATGLRFGNPCTSAIGQTGAIRTFFMLNGAVADDRIAVEDTREGFEKTSRHRSMPARARHPLRAPGSSGVGISLHRFRVAMVKGSSPASRVRTGTSRIRRAGRPRSPSPSPRYAPGVDPQLPPRTFTSPMFGPLASRPAVVSSSSSYSPSSLGRPASGGPPPAHRRVRTVPSRCGRSWAAPNGAVGPTVNGRAWSTAYQKGP